MTETESTANGVERRRSQRIPFSLPVYMMGLQPSLSFIKRCELVEISSHGCQLLAPRPLPRLTRVRLDRLTRVAITVAHVIRSTPVESTAVRKWRVGLELEAPGNIWGIAQPPPDWVTTP
ncbi:MAG: PilZ domain-containing protein [Nitrospirae bacterium]|nr:MAG: PilZ domain-containing protein [Nitrospirota bacterium]TLY39473.1 MAG: PilZ domain-containing protein [Nitrospirota bacterium]